MVEVDQYAVAAKMVRTVVVKVVVEVVVVVLEEEQIEVDGGHEQRPLVLELETAPLANALLVFVEGVAIPQLAVGVALRY